MASLVPRIPYIELHEWVVVPRDFFGPGRPDSAFSIKPFGTLVALGVYIGAYLAIRYGKRRGVSERALMSFITWTVGIGFLGGHVFDVLFYYPQHLRHDPLLLVRLWDGLSRFGGFSGAIIGTLAWSYRYKSRILPYADIVSSAFPVGWVFGRMGCSVAHDHPGVLSDAWYAVQYPGGGRYDLGLYEMLLTIPLALFFLYQRRKPQPWGYFCSRMCLLYAPPRFCLDFLREREHASSVPLSGAIDTRYGDLTPAQWACFALFVLGIYVYFKHERGQSDLSAPQPPPELVARNAVKLEQS